MGQVKNYLIMLIEYKNKEKISEEYP